jgi:hypothetical protein
MTKIILTLFIFSLLTLGGCNDESMKKKTSTSPLLTADKDWLYLVIRAHGGLRAFCYDYYASPKDPRYSIYKENCTKIELGLRDHLRLNKFPNIEVEHLRSAALGAWWQDQMKNIQNCQKNHIYASLKWKNCEPLYKKRKGNKLTFQDIGIYGKDPHQNPYQ